MNVRNDSDLPTEPLRQSLPIWFPLLLGIWLCGIFPCRGDDPSRPGGLWPSAIILEPPANRATLVEKLRRPDLVIWDGAAFDRWLATGVGGGTMVGSLPPPTGVVGSVVVTAQVDGAEARVRVALRLGVTLDDDDRTRVPIALQGLTLGRVSEAGRDLAVVSLGEQRGWAVELVGKGDHRIEIATSVPTRSTASGQELDLAIPAAAATEVELVAARPLVAARAGIDEPLPINGATAAGHLSPRSRLELTWQAEDPPGESLPTILTARGELAVTAGLDALTVRETWSVGTLRGVTREVVVQLKPDEEVVDLQVDRRPVAVNRRSSAGMRDDELLIPLAEPISTARTAIIALATRRLRPVAESSDPARFALGGHPIVGARSQTGWIGVARSDAITITPVERRGVRRVDPLVDLPESFRSRPDGWLGFEFAEQPFELGLQVEATVPRFEVNARSTVALMSDGGGVTTTLVGRVWQGRLFDLRVLVPPGLIYEPSDPAPDGPTIRSERKRPRAADASSAAPMATAEVLTATFAHALGPGDTFAITLRGACRLGGDGATSLGLFQPLGSALVATEVALVSARNRRFDLGQGSVPRYTRLDDATPHADWTWPTGLDPTLTAAAIWLRSDQAEAVLPVRVVTFPRSIHHQTTLTAAFDRSGADVVTELTGDVANGSTAALEVALAPEIADRWVAEAGEGLEREPLGIDPATGWRRYRLKLPGTADSFQVRVRYRLEFAYPAAGHQTRPSLRVQPLRLLEGISTSQTVRLASEPDVTLDVKAPGWTDEPGVSRGAPADSIQQVRHTYEHQGDPATFAAIDVTAILGTLAELPTLVASRLWLRSAELPGGELASTAQFRLETHARSVVIRLPAGSRWVRGVAGTTEVTAADVEQLDPDTYRITLPAAVGSGPMPLRVDSILNQEPADGSWPAPELVGGVVQQTLWELSLLGTRAGVGVPAGWTDENVWYRDGLLWKRHPRREEADLARWLADSTPGAAGTVPSTRPATTGSGDGAGDLASGHHSYLFSRPGPPTTLRFSTWARPTLLFLCSGPVLLVGLLILARRPPPRWVAGLGLTLGFVWVAITELNTVVLVAESSAVGFALAAIAALIDGSLAWRNRVTGESEAENAAPGSVWGGRSRLSRRALALPTGESDERTVIHAAPAQEGGSTGDYPIPAELDLQTFTPIEPAPEVEAP